jgi:Na+/phosphate symporter
MTFEQELPVVVLVRRFTVAPLQASDAVGTVNVGVAVHSIVAFDPAVPIVGAWVSTTVMTWVLVAE